MKNKNGIPRTRLQIALESVGWLIFFMVYSLGIIATILVVDHFVSIENVWKNWSIGEKWLYSFLWGLGLLVYTLIMLGMVLVFNVLSALIYSKLMKARIWAEKKTQEYIGEIIKIRSGNIPNPPPIPQGEYNAEG